MQVEVETDIAVTAKTVADLRALATWPDGLALNIHVDLDPRLSVVRAPDVSVPRIGMVEFQRDLDCLALFERDGVTRN